MNGMDQSQTCLPAGREYERQIDQMVYELYGLTKKEVEIVESSNKNI